jgi:hypothetical protein
MWLATPFGQRASRPRSRRLCLEILEDRTAPAVLTVTTTSDAAQYAGLSLRDAIVQANADAAANTSDTINFNIPTTDPGYNSTTGVFTITLAQGQLELSGASATATITIDGGTPGVTVDGNQASRILQVDAGVQAQLAHLTLRNGRALDGTVVNCTSPPWAFVFSETLAEGGGILNNGTLTVNNSVLTGNTSGSFNPLIIDPLWNPWFPVFVSYLGYFPDTSGDGGGIYNNGTLTLNNSMVSGNSAAFGWFPAGTGGKGGGIFNNGSLTINGSTVSGNLASEDSAGNPIVAGNLGIYGTGSGIVNNYGATAHLAGNTRVSGNWLMGIANRGTMDMDSCTVDHNMGGGLENDDTITITNSTFSYNTGGGIDNEGSLVLQGSLVANNTAWGAGGIYNGGPAQITNTTITGNHATGYNGGGLWTIGNNVTMTNCMVTNNTAARDGGGIASSTWIFVSFDYSSGTPVMVVTLGYGVVTLNNCTVSNNTAGDSGGGFINSDPFDLRPDTHEAAPATLTIADSTLDGNTASSGSGGAGAVFAGTLTMDGCTVNGNSAYQYGGGMYLDPAVVTILASHFAANSASAGADLYNLDSAVTVIASPIAGISNNGGTVTDPIATLLAQVAALPLNGGQRNSLSSTLQAAQQSLASAHTTAAVNQLHAFINQIHALVNSHRLGQITADALVGEVNDLLHILP